MAVISNGTTIADAGAFSASLGSMVHIKTVTASSSADVTFVPVSYTHLTLPTKRIV